MKTSYFFILISTFFIANISISQTRENAVITYKHFCDTDAPVMFDVIVAIQDNVAIYQEKYSTTEPWARPGKKLNENMRKSKDVTEPYIKVDRSKKEIYLFDFIMTDLYLVQDIYTELKWKITTESKIISGYKCTKASTYYRGREWVAWFAPEIPLSFGPWKLHGLPGLILEANDVSNLFSFKATKISYERSLLFDKDFKDLMPTHNRKAISYRKLLEDNEEAFQNDQKKIALQYPDVSIEIKKAPRSGLELKYEWEQ